VIWGQQSFDEMMVCMFNVAFDARISTRQMLAPNRRSPLNEQRRILARGSRPPAWWRNPHR
jgi:hypothetical protein